MTLYVGQRRKLILAGGGRRGVLIAPGILRAPFVSTRTQAAGVESSAPQGTDWRLYGADVPRFTGTGQRLLIEGARTNLTPNPRPEGFTAGVIGSGGVVPTGWGRDVAAGLTWEIIGTGTMRGLPYVEIRLSGTTSATAGVLRLMPTTAPNVGAAYTTAASLALVAGSTTNITSITIGNAVTGGTGTVNTAFALGSLSATDWLRASATATIGAGATAMANRLVFNHASGVAIDVTLRIAAPQLEEAPFASTPILPPVGTPGVSTRGADLLVAPLAGLGLPASGACTVLWVGMLPQAAPAGADQMLAQLDDGSAANRFRLRNPAGGADILAGRVTAGVAADAASAGTITAGTPFRAGITIDGAGRIAASLNGAAAVAVSGGPTGGLTTLRVGNDAGNTAPLFGEVEALQVLPSVLPDVDLAARVAALPLVGP